VHCRVELNIQAHKHAVEGLGLAAPAGEPVKDKPRVGLLGEPHRQSLNDEEFVNQSARSQLLGHVPAGVIVN
jgi:hypothetical protein